MPADRFQRNDPHPRRRSARAYVTVVRPLILAAVFALTLLTWLFDQPSVSISMWSVLGIAIAVQLVLAGIVLRRPELAFGTATFAFMFDAVLVLIGALHSPTPMGSSAIIIFFAVVAAFVLPLHWSVPYTLAGTIGITALAHAADEWPEPYWFPATALVALLSGTVSSFMSSRLERIERDLRREASDHRDSLHRLEQVGASRDRLVANVSHELRTPLTSTIGAVETLLRDDVQLDLDKQQELLRIARDGGLRLLSLVEDLLTIGSTRPESLDLTTSTEDLAAIARDAVTGLDSGDGRAIVVDTGDHPRVRVDRLRMLQVITNLVVNAIRHGEGDVVVRCSSDDGEAVVQVIDQGDGVAPEHVEELFLPFARFSGRPDSTGLGLAICRTLVEAHGGTIRYGRTTDHHTSFEVRLPAARRADR